MIRVLVVDDSITARESIAMILNSDPDVHVIGEAANGAEAIAQVAALKPDVITMDINMPIMNGFEATTHIMAQSPTPILVLTSVSLQELIHDGLDILLAGALEIVQKPGGRSDATFETIGSELIDKVKAISTIQLPRSAPAPAETTPLVVPSLIETLTPAVPSRNETISLN